MENLFKSVAMLIASFRCSDSLNPIIGVQWFTVKSCFAIVGLYIFGSLAYNHNEVITMATERQRYTVSVDSDMFQQIEDFRFGRRFQTRSEATVELIRLGLESLKEEKDAQK